MTRELELAVPPPTSVAKNPERPNSENFWVSEHMEIPLFPKHLLRLAVSELQ